MESWVKKTKALKTHNAGANAPFVPLTALTTCQGGVAVEAQGATLPACLLALPMHCLPMHPFLVHQAKNIQEHAR